MINSRYYFSPYFVAGAFVATVFLAVPAVVVATPVESLRLDERLFWQHDEVDADIIKRVSQSGLVETEVLDGNMREILPRIQFHTQFENRKPGGFFNELSFSQLPDVVYFRNELSGLKGGRQYLLKTYVYDPEGNRVKSGNDYEFALNHSQTSWNTWYHWAGEDLFTGPGDYRVESILVDRSDKRYLIFSRDLTIGK